MKICPSCSYSNGERWPTCILCNYPLADVESTPASNPDDPEHQKQALVAERHRVVRRQIRNATILYALLVTLTAFFPGLVASPIALLSYFASGTVVAIAVDRDLLGQITGCFAQGALSVLLVLLFGTAHPFMFFMLVAHIVFPTVLWHWMDMIHGAHR